MSSKRSNNVVLSLSVLVQASSDQVFTALTDWPRQNEWMMGSTVLADSPSQVGTKLLAYSGVRPFGIRDTMVITEWTPPTTCVVQHTGKVVRGTGTFQVETFPDGTSNFIWSENLELPLGFVGRIGWVLARPFFIWGVRVSLRRFASWAEAHKLN